MVAVHGSHIKIRQDPKKGTERFYRDQFDVPLCFPDHKPVGTVMLPDFFGENHAPCRVDGHNRTGCIFCRRFADARYRYVSRAAKLYVSYPILHRTMQRMAK